jgi:hypothetical protein
VCGLCQVQARRVSFPLLFFSFLHYYSTIDPVMDHSKAVCDHFILANLPTLESIVAYETGTYKPPQGYPRFVLHRFISEIEGIVQRALSQPCASETRDEGMPLALVASDAAAHACLVYCGGSEAVKIVDNGALLAALKCSSPALIFALDGAAAVSPLTEAAAIRMREFLQHTGCRLSSRAADAVRAALRTDASTATLPSHDTIASALHRIRRCLHLCCFVGPPVLGVSEPASSAKHAGDLGTDIILTNCGMAAFSAVFHALHLDSCGRGDRDDATGPSACVAGGALVQQQTLAWVQLGWLYLDTAKVMQRLGCVPAAMHERRCGARGAAPELVQIFDVHDLVALERVFADCVSWSGCFGHH